MNQPDPNDILAEARRFAEGIPLLRQTSRDLTPEQTRERPVPGKWSLLECICHMADFEAIIAHRVKLMLSFDEPDLPDIDESRYGAALHYQSRDLETELTLFETTRRQLLPVLSQLGQAEWSRTGNHSALGRVRLFEYFKSAAGHLEHHMSHLNDKRAALGLEPVACQASRDYPARGIA